MIDQKEWIQNKAEELSLATYDREFYDLTDHQRVRAWDRAEALYKDYIADQIDSTYERIRDKNFK